MKILDRYIIRNILITFIFITLFLQIISVIIDITQRMHRLEENKGSIKNALIYYYPFWSLWLSNTFSPISLFLSIIFFTSSLTKHSEMKALLTNGISFQRITIPYLFSAFIIGTISLIVNYFFLPKANEMKNKFHYQYLLNSTYKNQYDNNKTICTQVSKNGYLFIRNFSRKKNRGKDFVYQELNGRKLIYLLKAKNVIWFNKNLILYDYVENNTNHNYHSFSKGNYTIKKLPFTHEELLPEEYIAETMTIFKLKKFIDREKKKGSSHLNTYLNEYYQRTSLPISNFIFTILGLSISSKIKKGENDHHTFIGLLLAFFYLFFIEMFKVYSNKGILPSIASVILPNMIFMIITLLIYCNKNLY
ncbi:LptF/LptG family permease [Blattabacterium cuenoti]|uniref:LptF/LptG family permease n=1 Tax=Blattabacterium cuenoti TaxID=1653831 RepID=UPI00163C1655|nr:LptF/LptG family permease [Blattabacterium cuenoti]